MGKISKDDLRPQLRDEINGLNDKITLNKQNLEAHEVNYMIHIEGGISENVHGLAGKTIFETGSNENGRYIKYDDGTLICSNLYTFSVAVNLGSSPIWETNPTGNFPFAHTFIEVPVCTVSKGTGGTAWIVTTGATTTKCNPIYFFSKRSEAAISCQLSVIAIGRWK